MREPEIAPHDVRTHPPETDTPEDVRMPQADRRPPRGTRRRALTALGALISGVLVLTGCASMPDGGDVTKVGDEPRDASYPQVRVFGVQPQPDEQPQQIVEGFLEAVTSDEANFQTARDYLTGPVKKTWNPFTGTTIITGSKPSLVATRSAMDRTEPGQSITMSTSQVAEVGGDNSYAPEARPFRTVFHLAQAKGEWRIDALSNGLIIEQSDFERLYQSVDMYYYAKLGPQSGDSPQGEDTMVADPVYVRRRIDPVTATVGALLSGPSGWLRPVAASAFPEKAGITGQPKPAIDDSGRLRVQLSGLPARLAAGTCQRMAAQTLYTVQDQSSSQIGSVEIRRSSGATVCTLDRNQAHRYEPARLIGSGAQEYLVDADHRMESVPSQGTDRPQHVPGSFGAASAGLESVAVARGDVGVAAGLRLGGREIDVAPLSATGTVKRAFTSKVGLSAPSWDALGDLWAADLDPAAPGLWMWHDGHRVQARVPGLGGDRVQSVRVAADGVRVALLVERDGHTVLELGRVERSGTTAQPAVSVTGLRDVAPAFEDVQAVSWAGESRLVMVGRQWKSVQQLQYVDTDGSSAFTPPLPGISTVTAVAASEDQTRPLLVAGKEGVYRLPTDGQWTVIAENGTGPVYPG